MCLDKRKQFPSSFSPAGQRVRSRRHPEQRSSCLERCRGDGVKRQAGEEQEAEGQSRSTRKSPGFKNTLRPRPDDDRDDDESLLNMCENEKLTSRCRFQPSLSDPLRRRETRHGKALHKKKDKQRGAALNAAVPPHNLKAYQLYTLYRNKDGKIMQVGELMQHPR